MASIAGYLTGPLAKPVVISKTSLVDILFAVIVLAGFLAALLYKIGLNGISALFFTVLASCAAFYFWLMHEVSVSTNAYGLTAWPALLLIYLLIVIVAGASGIWLVKKSRSRGNQ